MKLWRLTRAAFVALDGGGPERHGARYSSAGLPIVNLASEAALAVLVALRYLSDDPGGATDLVLGWTEVDGRCERIPSHFDDAAVRAWVEDWATSRHSLLAALPSRVLPEADIVMMNPRHRDAVQVPPLVFRRFSFAECLHEPPMLARYRESS